jgi:transposase
MGEPERFIGIDVAKAWLDVAERPGGASWRVANDEAGWRQLIAALAGGGPVLIVVEASGGYELGVVTALDLAGIAPVVANPLATRRFAQSLGRRAKTDRIDAAMLASYGERMRPTPRPLPEATARMLQELLARHRQLTKMLVEEKNRRHQASALLRPGVEAHIAWLEGQRAEVDRLLESAVAADPAWRERVTVLDSAPGIGFLTATILAVGVPELGTCTAKEAAALVGVAPWAVESGQHRGQRRIAGGRSDVRHGLYEALTSTVRRDPTFGAHYARLKAAGKPHKLAMVACMRRLLGILTVMLRDGLAWQQTRVGQGQFLAPTP